MWLIGAEAVAPIHAFKLDLEWGTSITKVLCSLLIPIFSTAFKALPAQSTGCNLRGS